MSDLDLDEIEARAHSAMRMSWGHFNVHKYLIDITTLCNYARFTLERVDYWRRSFHEQREWFNYVNEELQKENDRLDAENAALREASGTSEMGQALIGSLTEALEIARERKADPCACTVMHHPSLPCASERIPHQYGEPL